MAAIAALCVGLAACDGGEDTQSTGLGWMNFSLTVEEVPAAPPDGPFSLTLTTDIGPSYEHTWPDITDFAAYQSYIAGAYRAVAVSGTEDAEGYGCPCYKGELAFTLAEGRMQEETLACTLQQALFDVAIDPALEAAYPGASVALHSQGYSYPKADPAENRPLLVLPGPTEAYITLADGQGREIAVCPGLGLTTEASTSYKLDISLDGEQLVAECSGKEARLALSPQLFASPAPEIKPLGYTPGQPISLTEGYPADHPVSMDINAQAGLKSVTLTINGLPPAYAEARECDLLRAPASLLDLGLKTYRVNDESMKVDFTEMLASLSVAANSKIELVAMAADKLGRVSQPSPLCVEIKSVDLQLVSKSAAAIGVDTASVAIAINTPNVEIEDFKGYILDDQGNPKREAKILHYQLDSEGRVITVSFAVDPGIAPVPMRIDYMDNPKLRFDIERQTPEYKIWVDPFATTAILVIEGETPAITRAITEYARVKANGVETGIIRRITDDGAIIISGLAPHTRYEISPVVLDGGFAPSYEVTTEEALDIPEGDFEDNYDTSISYKRLPMGGTYSTSQFPLFNMQNHKDVRVSWMQYNWASVNDKTFCKKASRHNTWYMQPSAMIDFENAASGTKSVRLQSVGWSLDGGEIAPYAQEDGEYLPYNNNVPYVEHRAAGRLFLGSYSFDPATGQEKYDEGLPFASRPSSLNGFYKYSPDASVPSDAGLVVIELVNDAAENPITVASASMELGSSPDFIAFNLPLTYEALGVKPTRLRLMFTSSKHAGSIAQEDAGVPASANVGQAAFLGSALWIDNLSFAY